MLFMLKSVTQFCQRESAVYRICAKCATCHKHRTLGIALAISANVFFLLPYTYQIFGTQAIQTAHYILHAHIVLFLACLCAHMRAFFFHSSQQDRAIIMFKPHLYFEHEHISTEKKPKLCRKEKNCFICAPHKSTHTVTAFFIQENKNSELPCHFLDFIKHAQTFQH